MPPKKHAAPPIPDDSPPSEEPQISAVETAEETIDHLLNLTLTEANQRHFDSLIIPTTSLHLLSQLNQTVHMNFLTSDPQTEPFLPIEAEPSPPTVDSWIRGKVVSKNPIKTKQFDLMEHMKSKNRGPSSVTGSFKGSFRGSSGGSRPNSRQVKLDNSTVPIAVLSFNNSNNNNENDEDNYDGEFRAPHAKSGMGTLMNGEGNNPLELTRMLKAESEKSSIEQKRLNDKLQKEKEESIVIEKQRKALLGREYTYDDDGSVIFIEQFDEASSGVKIVVPETTFTDYIERTELSSSMSRQRRSPPKSSNNNSRRSQRPDTTSNSNSNKNNNKYFTINSTTQPPLITTIAISSGVSLKTSNGPSKAGLAITGDAKHMSRKEYNDNYKRKNDEYYSATMGSGVSGSGNIGMDDWDETSVGSQESLSVDGSEVIVAKKEAAPKAMAMSTSMSEINSLSGGKMKAPVAVTQIDPTASYDDLHDQLLQSPTWGQSSNNSVSSNNPTFNAKKPSVKQKQIISQLSGGPNAKNRRDRMNPNAMIKNSDRVHLPSPPLAFARGGGGGSIGEGSSYGGSYYGNEDDMSLMSGSYVSEYDNGNMFPPINGVRRGGKNQGVIKYDVEGGGGE